MVLTSKTLFKLRSLSLVGLLFGASALGLVDVSGCTSPSGASAPPISLPAPVTGRMTVCSPDETGMALVVGDDGAVPAGSLVHAVNGSKETVALKALETLFSILPSAQAQSSFPEICTHLFHACALADENGSFELLIAAENDHEIVIEILDPATGQRISERLMKTVPQNFRHFARPVFNLGLFVNPAISEHKLYVLMPRTLDDPNGSVSVANLDTGERTPVPFDGPHPERMAVDSLNGIGIVLDSEGEFIAQVDLNTNTFNAPLKFNLGTPRDVVLRTDGSAAYVATAETIDAGTPGDARFIRTVNVPALTDGDPIRVSRVQTEIPGATNIETRRLDLISFNDGPLTFDLVAFVGMFDVGGTPRAVLGLMDPLTPASFDAITLPSGTDPEDVAFLRTSNRIMVTDSGNDRILFADFTYVTGTIVLTPAGEINSGELQNPRDIALLPDGPYAFVTAKNGTADLPDTVLTIDLAANAVVELRPVGFGPSGLVFDPQDQVLYISTLKSHSVTFWGLPDLLP